MEKRKKCGKNILSCAGMKKSAGTVGCGGASFPFQPGKRRNMRVKGNCTIRYAFLLICPTNKYAAVTPCNQDCYRFFGAAGRHSANKRMTYNSHAVQQQPKKRRYKRIYTSSFSWETEKEENGLNFPFCLFCPFASGRIWEQN